MKRLFALLLLVLVIFLVVYRNRVFLRDPLARVERNGTRLGNVAVYVNYPEDLLLQDGSSATPRLYLVQHWNLQVGTPTVAVKCLQGLGCMTDANHATEAIVSRNGAVAMTPKEIDFKDENGAEVKVTLR